MGESMTLDADTLGNIYNTVAEFLVNYSFQVLGAFIILILGWIIARWLSNVITRFCEARDVDVTLSKFIGSCTYLLLLACFVIIALGNFGISVAPFVAAVGALTLGAGLALQGPVSNYGAGFIIILTRPFVVGNTISVAGISGTVEEVKLGMTLMRTEDDELIVVPNRHLIGEVLYNSFENKIVEGTVAISYSSNVEQVIETLTETLCNMDCVAETPEVKVGIEAFGDSGIVIGLRYWIPAKNYFGHKYAVNAMVYRALREEGVRIPFPQREVRILE